MAERGRGSRDGAVDEPEDADRAALELVVPVDPRQAKQHRGEHRVARRRRVVLEILLARDELLPVGGREEEAAALVVGEELDGEAGQAVRLLEPAELTRRDMQLEQAVCSVGVVLEVARALGLACAKRAVQAVTVGERAEQELAEPARRVEVVAPLEPAARFGQCSQGQPVPRRDRLVVAQRLRVAARGSRTAAPARRRSTRRGARIARARTAGAAPRARLRRPST